MYIKVKINSAKLPKNIYNSYVEYKLFGKLFRTEIVNIFITKIFFFFLNLFYLLKINISKPTEVTLFIIIMKKYII